MIQRTALKLVDVQVLSKSQDLILHNISFDIKKDSCTLILGPTGSGKTTILRLIKGLIPYLLDYTVNGTVFVDNKLKTEKNFFQQSIEIGLLFQDFEFQFVGSTVEQELVFSLENMGQSQDVIAERIDWIANNYPHIKNIMNRNPHTLSGGELAQVVFLSTILSDQDYLLFDEPLQNLDSQGAKIFLDTLQSFLNKKTIIISTHHVEPFLPSANNFIILNTKGNKIDHYNSKKEFLENVHHYSWLNLSKKAIDYYLKMEG